MLLLLLACANESRLHGDEAPADAPPATSPGTAPDDTGPGLRELVQLPAGTDWTAGLTLSGATPFQGVRLVAVADPSVTFYVVTDAGEVPLAFVSTEGDNRVAELSFGGPVEALDLRADGPVEWSQVELFETAIYHDDDWSEEDPGRSAERAVGGMWVPDAETLAVGMTMYLPYEYADTCVGTTLPGTLTLASWLKDNTEGNSYGTYACRSIVGGSGMSVHSEGRAIDLFVTVDTGSEADNEAGDPIAAYLIAHSEEIGISLVIWDRASWGAHRSGDKHDAYTGTHPHNDHLHIELTTDGAMGSTPWFGDPEPFVEAEVEGWIDIAATPSGQGYWVAHTDGRVKAIGDAVHAGDPSGLALAGHIVGIAASPAGNGYCLAGADGGVFCYGDAPYYGSMGGVALNAPVVDITMRPGGDGYWLTAEDGGVFSFGAAGFHGSMGGTPMNAPVIGIESAPGGGGYWLLGSDGGVFTFGAASYQGSTGDMALNAPVTSIAASAAGYWLFAEDGGVFAFGDAGYYGGLADLPLAMPISGGEPTPTGAGYWMVGLDGGVFTAGDAGYYGNAL